MLDKCYNITLALLSNFTLIGIRGQIQYLFGLLTNENIIFMSKIGRQGLINYELNILISRDCTWDNFLTKSSKIAYYCSPPYLYGIV